MYHLPKLQNLPVTMLRDGTINIRLEKGIPIFQASTAVQEQIQFLLQKQQEGSLSPDEIEELNCYEEIDDYLSYLNRVVRNLQAQIAPT